MCGNGGVGRLDEKQKDYDGEGMIDIETIIAVVALIAPIYGFVININYKLGKLEGKIGNGCKKRKKVKK